MSSKSSRPPTETAGVAALRNFEKALAEAASVVCAEGNLAGAQRIAACVQNLLDASPDALKPWLDKAQGATSRLRHSLGADLRDLAASHRCHFDFRPPYITFGCVTLHERTAGIWELSILDGVTIDTLPTQSATTIANAAFNHIRAIEDSLKDAKLFAKTLGAAYQWLRHVIPERTFFSPNLLMLLCTHGRGIRRQLTSSLDSGAPISRAQFGFLLSRVHTAGQSWGKEGVRLEYHGATQHVTKDASRFVSLPGSDDPRHHSQHTPIADLAVYLSGGQ